MSDKLVKTDRSIAVAGKLDVMKALGGEDLAEVLPTIVMVDPGSLYSDRSDWSRGPWDNEPDRVEWRSEGGPCLVLRGPVGAWSGYIGVNPGHPWHNKTDLEVDVHGGITYAAANEDQLLGFPAFASDLWIVGFDCAHVFDTIPKYNRGLGLGMGTYRDLDYVRAEVENLAKQARNAAR